jgi:hypothetical protein
MEVRALNDLPPFVQAQHAIPPSRLALRPLRYIHADHPWIQPLFHYQAAASPGAPGPDESVEGVRVFVRVRPPSEREMLHPGGLAVTASTDGQTVVIDVSLTNCLCGEAM